MLVMAILLAYGVMMKTIDGGMTYAALRLFNSARELNPVARLLFKIFGMLGGLVIGTLIWNAVLIALFMSDILATMIGMDIAVTAVVVWNYFQFKKAERRYFQVLSMKP